MVTRIELIGYHYGRTLINEEFIASLKSHGLIALGREYPIGPMIFLDHGETQTDVKNYYHTERRPDQVQFTDDPKAIKDAIASSFHTFISETLSNCITLEVAAFLMPTPYDQLRRAMQSWLHDTRRPIALLDDHDSWGKWRLTQCQDAYPAFVRYYDTDNGEISGCVLDVESQEERNRLARVGIHFPQRNERDEK